MRVNVLRPFFPALLLIPVFGWTPAVGEEPRASRLPGAPAWSRVPGLGTGRLWTLDPGDLANTMTSDMRADLETLRHSEVPTKRDAERVAAAAKREAWGIGKTETCETVSLLKAGIKVPGFAAVRDFMWVVRFQDASGMIGQEAWVSTTTARVRWMLPMDEATLRANTPGAKH